MPKTLNFDFPNLYEHPAACHESLGRFNGGLRCSLDRRAWCLGKDRITTVGAGAWPCGGESVMVAMGPVGADGRGDASGSCMARECCMPGRGEGG